MEFIPFSSRHKDIAQKEARGITVATRDVGVPLGQYIFEEYYCIDDSCDCRKVMLNLVWFNSSGSGKILATIGYGWESTAFYTKWMFGDREMGKLMTGAYLELGGIQSKYDQALLEIFLTRLTKKDIAVFKRHYNLFKSRK